MKKRIYSDEIASRITDFLTEDNWMFSFHEETGIFQFVLRLKGALKRVNYVIDVQEDAYIVYAISPLGADEKNPKMMANMAEFICHANYSMKMGNFEFDYRDGEVRFKNYICCEGVLPSVDMIKRSIYCPATMFDSYGAGIMDVIFADMSGKEAAEKCDRNRKNELQKMLMEFFSRKEVCESTEEDTDEEEFDLFAEEEGES